MCIMPGIFSPGRDARLEIAPDAEVDLRRGGEGPALFEAALIVDEPFGQRRCELAAEAVGCSFEWHSKPHVSRTSSATRSYFQTPGPGTVLRLGGKTAIIKRHLPAHAGIPGHMAAILLFEKRMTLCFIRHADALPVGLGEPLGNLALGSDLLGHRPITRKPPSACERVAWVIRWVIKRQLFI